MKSKKIIGESSSTNEVSELLESAHKINSKIRLQLDLGLARGLSYYTGLIFEVQSTQVKMGSICGGGRYDDLTGIFGLQGMSGVGISFGLDRIYDVMEESMLFPEELTKRLQVLIVHFSQKNFEHGQGLIQKLRQSGIKADLYPDVVKIQKQFTYADKMKVPYVLIIGDDEMNSGNYSVKDLSSGEQSKREIEEIIEILKTNFIN